YSGQIVFASQDGVTTEKVKSTMTAFFAELKKLDGVNIASPFETPGQIDQSGKTAFAVIDISIRSQQEMIDLSEKIQDLEANFTVDGLQIEYGGEIFAAFELPESEAYGLLAAIIILVIAFGSVMAMGLPIGTAILGLGVGVSTVGIASQLVSMPDFTTSLVAMIGLGVGIDYALFIVTRYRECLADGLSVEDSVVEAVDTSGRAVIFAGITVIISLLGLFVMGLAFARGLAIGAVIGVLFMIVASITRVDTTTRAALIGLIAFVSFAFVALLQHNLQIFFAGIIATVVIMLLSFVIKPLRQPIKHRAKKAKELTFWYRWSRFIQRRPWTAAISATAVLLVLSAPLASIRLGFGDTGNDP
ncbi:MAG: MMPL family transporter, partial [Actinobacteria bacterium]|nr:MMPL family transporter [Actinomycetota bacterium]